MNHQWIFKTHDDVPAIREALAHPRTRTNDDFLILRSSSESPSHLQEPKNGNLLCFFITLYIPEITALDHFILQNGYITVNVERLPSYLKQSKLHPALTIPDLQREIGRLQQEITFHQEAHVSLMKLFSDDTLHLASQQHALLNVFILLSSTTKRAVANIHASLNRVSEKLAASETQLLLSYGIALDDINTGDYAVL
ncbi:hypothetical protein GB937_008869 [Aspergillus fischeri]|nr:hypothetical protein GB937_008869 [Aspergillus fischeri]